MSTKSRQILFGSTIQVSSARARKAGLEADVLACAAWNYRMLGYKGPAGQQSAQQAAAGSRVMMPPDFSIEGAETFLPDQY